MDPHREPSFKIVEEKKEQEEEAETPSIAATVEAVDPFAKEIQPVSLFKWGNGYVEPAELPPPAATAPEAATASAYSKGGETSVRRRRGFYFHNRNLTDAIWLYGNQVTSLVDELPKAYSAYFDRDLAYRFELVKSKGQLVTLEVSLYNERIYLFMKKYFKPRLPASNEIDEASEWLPTPAVISFDPAKDKPLALLKFALGAHRQRARHNLSATANASQS